MKYCQKCNERYKDENLNFCLNDGAMLSEMSGDDAPPTVMLDSSRVTNDNWGDQNTNFSDFNQENQQIYQQPFSSPNQIPSASNFVGQDKTLPIIALVVGSLSLVFSCCYFGIILGPVALITGYLGILNVNKDPETYAGKELAIIGMVLGGISLGVALLFIFINILSIIAG